MVTVLPAALFLLLVALGVGSTSCVSPRRISTALFVQLAELLFFDFQAWSGLAQHLGEFGLASFLSGREHCGKEWIACVGHYAGIILGVWWLSGTLT